MIYEHERVEKSFVDLEDRVRPRYPREVPELLPAMEGYLEGRDLSFGLARKNLWYPAFYRDDSPRIVIPCTNTPAFPYFQARAMDDNPKRYDSPHFPRHDSLALVWPRSLRSLSRVVVVIEGPLDALAAAGEGYLGIGLMGSNPSYLQINHISQMLVVKASDRVLIVPDLDSPELGPMLVSDLAQEGVRSEIRMPSEKDLAKMERQRRRRLLS